MIMRSRESSNDGKPDREPKGRSRTLRGVAHRILSPLSRGTTGTLTLLAVLFALALVLVELSNGGPNPSTTPFSTLDKSIRIRLAVLHFMDNYPFEGLKRLVSPVEEKESHEISDSADLGPALLGLFHEAAGHRQEARETWLQIAPDRRILLLPSALRRRVLEDPSDRIDSNAAPSGTPSPAALFLDGLYCWMESEKPEALERLEEAFRLGFDPHLATCTLWAARNGLNDFDSAEACAAWLIRNGDASLGYLLGARTALDRKEPQKAMSRLERVAPPFKHLPCFQRLEGAVKIASGHTVEGETTLYRLLTRFGDYGPALLDLCRLHLARNRLESAWRDLMSLPDPPGNTISVLLTRAYLTERLGWKEETPRAWQRVVAINPSNPIALRKLGFYDLERGEYHNAYHRLYRAAEKGSVSPALAKGLLEAARRTEKPRYLLTALRRLDDRKPGDSNVQLELIQTMETVDGPGSTLAYLKRQLASKTLSSAGCLLYLERLGLLTSKAARRVVGDVVMCLARKPRVSLKVLFSAGDLIRTPLPDGFIPGSLAHEQALAGKAVILSDGRNRRALTWLISIQMKRDRPDQAERTLRHFQNKYPENQDIKDLMKGLRGMNRNGKGR